MAKLVLIVGVLFAMTAVIAGALEHKVHAMILEDTAGEEVAETSELSDPAPNPEAYRRFSEYETGVKYQMYHGLGMIGLGLLMAFSARGQVLGLCSALSMFLGVKLFSGTLYMMAAFGMDQFVLLVPIGGSLMILGWILFLITVLLFDPLIDKEDLESMPS
ncbi:DUF423 domain-containing protein [bacterium]|nr:DUF423 domain-containing protein [bacterium]